MKKRTMILLAAALGCFLVAGCGDKKSKDGTELNAEQAAAGAAEAKPAVWEGEYECKKGNNECRDDKIFGEGIFFGGTIFNTVINKDVNARTLPTTKGSDVLTLVKAGTKIQILGVSKDGWAFAVIRDGVPPKRGWIYGPYIDYRDEQTLTAAELKITDFNLTAQDSSTAELIATYKAGDVEKDMKISAFKERGQSFFTFIYDIYTDQSHYSVMPGVYVWNFANNQLRHAAFLTRTPYAVEKGSEIWEKAVATEDSKFYFITESNKILAFRTADGKQLFPDAAVKFFSPRQKTITLECPADEAISRFYESAEEMDDEISQYGYEFVSDNPQPDGLTLEVLCEVSLETGSRTIISASWR